MPDGQLHERVVLIVGGTGGIGAAATKACLAQGARVVAVGLEAPGEGLEAGDQLRILHADARSAETAPAGIAAAMESFGRLDGVFHVAGGSGRKFGDGPLHELSDEAWLQTLDLNLNSLFYTARAATGHFLASGGGSVLLLTSVLGQSPAPKHFATHGYATSKAAVEGLLKGSAAYYAAHSIRFNAIAPGLVATEGAARALSDPAIRDYVHARQPLSAGPVTGDDVAAAAVYFLSAASRHVTGQILHVDGGWSVGH